MTKRLRQVYSLGWLYWLARHKDLGLVLLDDSNQDGVPEKSIRAFLHSRRTTQMFDRQEFKAALSGYVGDNEFVMLLNAYSVFKANAGMPPKPTPSQAHAYFLRSRGLPVHALLESSRGSLPRLTHCWSCKQPLSSFINLECEGCKWIICSCGACGCGRT